MLPLVGKPMFDNSNLFLGRAKSRIRLLLVAASVSGWILGYGGGTFVGSYFLLTYFGRASTLIRFEARAFKAARRVANGLAKRFRSIFRIFLQLGSASRSMYCLCVKCAMAYLILRASMFRIIQQHLGYQIPCPRILPLQPLFISRSTSNGTLQIV